MRKSFCLIKQVTLRGNCDERQKILWWCLKNNYITTRSGPSIQKGTYNIEPDVFEVVAIKVLDKG